MEDQKIEKGDPQTYILLMPYKMFIGHEHWNFDDLKISKVPMFNQVEEGQRNQMKV